MRVCVCAPRLRTASADVLLSWPRSAPPSCCCWRSPRRSAPVPEKAPTLLAASGRLNKRVSPFPAYQPHRFQREKDELASSERASERAPGMTDV